MGYLMKLCVASGRLLDLLANSAVLEYNQVDLNMACDRARSFLEKHFNNLVNDYLYISEYLQAKKRSVCVCLLFALFLGCPEYKLPFNNFRATRTNCVLTYHKGVNCGSHLMDCKFLSQ